MNLSLKKDKILSFSIVIFLPIFFSILINFLLNVNLHHDSLLMYLNYKFIYNYLLNYNNFPEWIDYIYSGLDATILYIYDVSKIFFPFAFVR